MAILIDPFDEFGFQVNSNTPWKAETVEEEIERLKYNLLKYEQFLENRTRFPQKISDERTADFHRLRELRGKHK